MLLSEGLWGGCELGCETCEINDEIAEGKCTLLMGFFENENGGNSSTIELFSVVILSLSWARQTGKSRGKGQLDGDDNRRNGGFEGTGVCKWSSGGYEPFLWENRGFVE